MNGNTISYIILQVISAGIVTGVFFLVRKSLMNILTSNKSGQVDKNRGKAFTGKERHNMCREDKGGYPCRAVRTKDFLYIRNFEPDRWPAGACSRPWRRHVPAVPNPRREWAA